MFIFEVDFLLEIEDSLCLLPISWLEIKQRPENSSTLIHEMYKEKVIKKNWEKMSKVVKKKYIENYESKILVRIQFILEVYVYRERLQKN